MSNPVKPLVLYPRRSDATLDAKLFAHPPREYRGTPFWCWNDRLDRDQLRRQIDVMKRMGFGGFHVHSRTGLATEYLGTTWMNLVAMCTDIAEREQMLCWLYDEDRWPSGYAGGLATRDPRYRQRHLLWTRIPYGQNAPCGRSDYTTAIRNETGRLVARYDVELDSEFRLLRYRRLDDGETLHSDQVVWHAYIESATPSSWFNDQTAIDVLSREAIEHFISTTHERYRAAIGDRFGTIVPAIFTDEPQHTKKSMFARGNESHDLFMPIAETFFDTYRAAYDQDLLDHLPELFWNLRGDAPSLARYRYHEHATERMAEAFGDTLGQWCGKNGIALTGHMLGESSLMSQTRGEGEAMRGLRSFQLPGIDMLCDKRELTTAKQAQSVAHQFDREGVVSELYGVTGWHFDFVGHKAQGDWQAALGVTVRVPHLFWMSMRGEAKRDYPASIGEQSPWFAEYPIVEDHFARVNTVMTRGTPATKIAVIHPVESAWMHWGPTRQNANAVQQLEESFAILPEWLLFGLADFDYLSESLLASHGATLEHEELKFGAMCYGCVIVPPMKTIRSTTLDVLEQLLAAGGIVIFCGEIAECVDAVTSERARLLAARSVTLPFARRPLLDAVARWCDVSVTLADGSLCDSILHQLRIDGEDRQLFLVNTDRTKPRRVRINLRGRWAVVAHDTFNGTSAALPRMVLAGETVIEHTFTPHGHLLLTLQPATDAVIEIASSAKWVEVGRVVDPIPITLSEPNVLLLDRARFRLSDSEQWSEALDILRIDNLVRSRFDLSLRTGRGVQPWADKEPAPVLGIVQLAYDIHTETETSGVDLAIENPEDATIRLDGTLLSNVPIGWWVDQSISRVALDTLRAGQRVLRIDFPFTRKTELEACYLLGDFGVRVAGAHASISSPVRRLAWGDYATQGLPFYGGNVTYHAGLGFAQGAIKLVFPKFSNPLLSVACEQQLIGRIAFDPFEVIIPPGKGTRPVDITAFGNRANTFGPLHHSDESLKWIGPAAWRSSGLAWQEAYVLKRMGVLAAPIVYAAR